MRLACLIPTLLVLLIGSSALADEAKRLTKAEAIGAAVTKVQPEYPPVARQLKLEGTVEVEATVDESGAVSEVREVSGNPVLAKAAANAVKRWKFTPIQSGGKPVKAIAPLSFAFTK